MLQVSQVHTPGMRGSVSFALQRGELVMLSGRSGSGKSLLMKALADLLPHDGEVRLNGDLQTAVPAPLWRRQVMYFAAETAWWRDTVDEHFETVPEEAALAAIGLKGADLQRSVATLSSGEKQRLALLRGLQYAPSVLLLDEISANLDHHTTLQVERYVLDYCQTRQAAVLWVSHDLAQHQRLVDAAHCWSLDALYEENLA
ncbi:ABC transporter ATP-binding protein [Thiomicrorhabdus cannonii]|uniref:ABC transporter ATP-binding protein n=1 Tax=Thiomicrorhabdus cannonii TaxID=2748011 RepID=UPI0015BFA02A|nr:ATP-binding cassette domain-containing protein [Thiomicrorhabdus cannonii]